MTAWLLLAALLTHFSALYFRFWFMIFICFYVVIVVVAVLVIVVVVVVVVVEIEIVVVGESVVCVLSLRNVFLFVCVRV